MIKKQKVETSSFPSFEFWISALSLFVSDLELRVSDFKRDAA